MQATQIIQHIRHIMITPTVTPAINATLGDIVVVEGGEVVVEMTMGLSSLVSLATLQEKKIIDSVLN